MFLLIVWLIFRFQRLLLSLGNANGMDGGKALKIKAFMRFWFAWRPWRWKLLAQLTVPPAGNLWHDDTFLKLS